MAAYIAFLKLSSLATHCPAISKPALLSGAVAITGSPAANFTHGSGEIALNGATH
jgi:hypothetical protein